MISRRHGFGLGSVMIVLVAGVAFYLAWNSYQSEAGINQQQIITEKNTLTKSNIEELKRLSVPALSFASKDASMKIASSGGTLAGDTVWYCDNMSSPPSRNEVIYSLSFSTLTNFNKYLDDSTEMAERLKIGVVPYSCVAIESQTPDKYLMDDYPQECDSWDIKTTGGYIFDTDTDESHRHVQDISATADEDRFLWMYYRLVEAERDHPFLAEVKTEYENNLECSPDDPDCCIRQSDIEAAFNSIKNGNPLFDTHFDKYVECVEEIDCIELRSVSARITCTDKKYMIPGDDETGEKYLSWTVKEMITLGCEYEECVVAGGSSGGGSTNLPPVSMHGTSDSNIIQQNILSFQQVGYCDDHMKCFDIQNCTHTFDEDKLCFNP